VIGKGGVVDIFEDLELMLDPKGKGYVILDGIERDNPSVGEMLQIDTK